MHLTLREPKRFSVYQVTGLSRRRRRGTMLPLAEAQALRPEATPGGDCLAGTRGRLPLRQASATVVDGSRRVSCHDPVAA